MLWGVLRKGNLWTPCRDRSGLFTDVGGDKFRLGLATDVQWETGRLAIGTDE